jgi:hypothetical protein
MALMITYPLSCMAEEAALVSIEDDQAEFSASCYPADSPAVALFLPSAYPPLEKQIALTREIAHQGMASCFSHVFSDLFLPKTNNSFQEIPAQGMLKLIHRIHEKTQKPLFLVTQGRAAKTGFRIAQLAIKSGNPSLKGHIMFSPNLLDRSPDAGMDFRYIDDVHNKSIACFIYQPERSPHHWYLDRLLSALKKAGTTVHAKRLPRVRDGYSLRDSMTEDEIALRKTNARLLLHAVTTLTDKK